MAKGDVEESERQEEEEHGGSKRLPIRHGCYSTSVRCQLLGMVRWFHFVFLALASRISKGD